MSDQNQKQKIGACWIRKTKTGDKFISQKLNLKSFGIDKEIDLISFLNRNKKSDKHPDFETFPSEPRPQNKVSPPEKATTTVQAQEDNSII